MTAKAYTPENNLNLILVQLVTGLRGVLGETMRTWGGEILSGAFAIRNRWAQVFVVLMYCRMLHSLATGEIGSKVAGAAWARTVLHAEWMPLIDDALSAREWQYEKIHVPADPAKVARTIAFVDDASAMARVEYNQSR